MAYPGSFVRTSVTDQVSVAIATEQGVPFLESSNA